MPLFLRCVLAAGVLALGLLPLNAQDLPPCTERPNWTFEIRARPERYCVEFVWQDASAGEMGFTGLAFAPDGRLFAARPLQGQVLMLRDTNGDTQPDTPQIIAEGLDRPNTLLYTDEALYIAGGASLYRLDDAGTLTTLVDDLPAETGLWNGGLASDGTYLYVGIGACEGCATEDNQRGTIVRVPMAGGSALIYARGLRQPLGLLWHDEALWATDSTRPVRGDTWPAVDELNQVVADAHYGYPACVGLPPTPNALPEAGIVCEQTQPPVLALPAESQPSALVLYQGAAFPHLQGKVLLALMGSTNRSDVRGYGVIAFDFPPPAAPFPIETLLPYDASITSGADTLYDAMNQPAFEDMSYLNRRGVGLWPRHLYGLAVSPQGWIYLSVGGGTILSLRPR